jgi:hypothetical protein
MTILPTIVSRCCELTGADEVSSTSGEGRGASRLRMFQRRTGHVKLQQGGHRDNIVLGKFQWIRRLTGSA